MIFNGALFAESRMHTAFEWGRIQSPRDWIAPLAVGALLLLLSWFLYRRDSGELPGWLRLLLAGLRLAVLIGLLVVYLEPQWRNEREQVSNSRVLLLADTSQSMALADDDASPVPAGQSRAGRIAASLAEGRLLSQLRGTHEVIVARFDENFSRIASLGKLETPSVAPGGKSAIESGKETQTEAIEWEKVLEPRGSETRLGQALRQFIDEERAGPVSGLVVLTDGQHNAGLGPDTAARLAREAEIPIFPVGIGDLSQPVNVRISDLLAPARAYPGDHYTVTGYVQAQGLAGRTVKAQLFSRDASQSAADGRLESEQTLALGGDGEVVAVKFDVEPREIGRRTLLVVVQPPVEDSQAGDNQQEADIEVVDRKTRALLFSGGPSREYQFLRNQLRRDGTVVLDVLLQSGAGAISQDASAILEKYPSTREELFAYDCLVAIDPDWRALSAEEIAMTEEWVGYQSGGLIAMAGPIHTNSWSQDPGLSRIRGLYPVEFARRFSVVGNAEYRYEEPWAVDLTREGLEAEFLWLDESAPASARAWSDFPGVFSCYAVSGAKPGATVYARFSNPSAGAGDERQVYMAGQFYGSGRVFYLGSGEMWRLRSQDESYFERLYTRLLRHVTQGRLLRGSSRGTLLVERDRYLRGSTVLVGAQLTDARIQPLQLPQVALEVHSPDSTELSVVLAADPARAGNYRGQFTARMEGVYRLELSVPESASERLTRRIQVRVPELEREDPRRNDALLSDLANKTAGHYFVGLSEALGDKPGVKGLAERLRDQSRTVIIAAMPTRLWDNQWTMYTLCGLLCLEWLIRRLVRLA